MPRPPARSTTLEQARRKLKQSQATHVYDAPLPDPSQPKPMATSYDWYTVDQCRRAADVGSYDTWGYKNHYTACIVFRPRINIKRCTSSGS
jgi:hypothetical protein